MGRRARRRRVLPARSTALGRRRYADASAVTSSSRASPSTRTSSFPQVEECGRASCPPGDETDDGPETYGARKADVRAGRRGGVRRRERSSCGRASSSALTTRRAASRTGRTASHAAADVLAPASPEYAVQFIDVRDLAGWIVRAATGGLGGTFNATGETMPLGHLLAECIRVTAERRAARVGAERHGCSRPAPRSGWACLSGSSRLAGRP